MTWIQTYSGVAFDLIDPRPEDVRIDDIAHALSLICRFTGHARWHYSVAQHCVIMSEMVDEEHALWALLHDSAEAYVNDLARPLKHCPGMEGYAQLEANITRAILTAVDFSPLLEDMEAVRVADVRMLGTEARQLLTWPPPREWRHDAKPYDIELEPWAPEFAEEAYLGRFEVLTLPEELRSA